METLQEGPDRLRKSAGTVGLAVKNVLRMDQAPQSGNKGEVLWCAEPKGHQTPACPWRSFCP